MNNYCQMKNCNYLVYPTFPASKSSIFCDTHFLSSTSRHATMPKVMASRNNDDENEAYYLISPSILHSLARVYAEGAKKYGEFNWEKGLSAKSLLNRTFRHLRLWMEGDREEPHLDHALWNLGAMIHSLEHWPELNKEFLLAIHRRKETKNLVRPE